MRLVLDTNVLVSALLNPGRMPDRALCEVRSRNCIVLFDARIEEEYRSVLARRKFEHLDRSRTSALIEALLAQGERVTVSAVYDGAMPDPDDRAFIEVALAGNADAIVTGNARHYPTDQRFEVLTPTMLVERLVGSASP